MNSVLPHVFTRVAPSLQHQQILYKQMKYYPCNGCCRYCFDCFLLTRFKMGLLFCAEFHVGENSTNKSKHFIKTTNHPESAEIVQPGIIKLLWLPLLC